jgi:TatD DNase family protein
MEYFESHAHYDDEKFNIDREKLIEQMYKENVTKIISAGYSLDGSIRGIELSKKYDFIYTTVGISPNDLNNNYKKEINEIDGILEKYFNDKKSLSNIEKIDSLDKSPKIVAVGEIGLDYHYNEDKDMQKDAFNLQINLANKYNLPIVIHTREAVMDTLEILKNNNVKNVGTFHCCPFNRELVKEALKLGFYISFGGTCTFKNAKNAEEIVKMVPDDKFLIETDSPYLAPEPVRGTRNDSRNLKYIVKKIAEFKQESEEAIAKKSYENATRLFLSK